ncbi:spermidine/putrescine ABC transporter permease PotC [Neiella marina]|uniref:Spermidine/putrescine transport system permease protein PotC n=1 Tax=Neiella holothuriorum TaxID=2870530 RepID=A0ABS7EEU7_9GAMM|nr:spermidine/putrescine ABC transporter permease PotC [Neiella holothuriorum]MBW8190448.1 spermidine/putrescine ABC transporter permease PotC [Neiella holothuriorum]
MTRIFKALLLLLVFVYLYAPIAVLVVNSFNQSKYGYKWSGFSWKWYQKLWQNDALITAFNHSITIAFLAATAAAMIGTLMALAIYRYRFRLKKAASSALFVVMMSPDIVLAISFLVLFVALGMQLGFWTLLLAHITFCLPFVVVTVYAQLKGFDDHLLEAAQDLGVNEWGMFRTILLPLLLPSILASWLLSFTLSLDDVIISSFVTGPDYEVLPIRVFSMVKVGVSPEVNVLATLLLLISILSLIVFSLLVRRKSL